MTSVNLGKNIAIISAAALLLAACSSNDTDGLAPGSETEDTGVVSTNTGGNGQPDAVTTVEVEADPLADPTQTGLDLYAGTDRVLFAYDSSDLSAAARSILDKQATWLNANRYVNATVEGHCDERGTREYNLALGDRRATAVKNYLVALGVPASRLNTISYGKERPYAPGDFAQNRRGVLKVN